MTDYRRSSGRNTVIIRATSSPRDGPVRFWEFNLAFLSREFRRTGRNVATHDVGCAWMHLLRKNETVVYPQRIRASEREGARARGDDEGAISSKLFSFQKPRIISFAVGKSFVFHPVGYTVTFVPFEKLQI